MNFVTDIQLWISKHLGIAPQLQLKLFSSLLSILLLWLAQKILLRIILRRVETTEQRYRWRKSITYALVFVGIFIVGRIWFEGFSSIATIIGIASAGLAIALQEPISNIAGWLFIIWRKPFDVGDRIQIQDVTGDVIDIRLFTITLMEIGNWVQADQPTGRVIRIPNRVVFSQPVSNYNRGWFPFIWDEIPVLITFESDWETAKQILTEIVTKHGAALADEAEKHYRARSAHYYTYTVEFAPQVITSVEDSGILLTLRYLCDPWKRRKSRENIWEDILRAFAQYDTIDFAYPTQRWFNNALEGKPGTRPSE